MGTWKGTVSQSFTPDAFDSYVKTVKFGAWRPSFVVVHNTQEPKLASWHSVNGDRRMKGFTSYYRDDQKWSGGPHLFVADDLVWVFTPLNVPGVHTPSWNSVAWGVELVGDYDHEPFGDQVRENAVRALAALHGAAGLDPSTLKLHKEDPKTTHTFCPGVHVDKADLVARIQQHLAEQNAGEHGPERAASVMGHAASIDESAAMPRLRKLATKTLARIKRATTKRGGKKSATKRRAPSKRAGAKNSGAKKSGAKKSSAKKSSAKKSGAKKKSRR
ncbi:MAG: N-acetylmuramoyl-L-alanine amidase [Gemmatimonadota bacterium]|nr:N-acetylmuramoyl-L-alanine amidase [Gemmatimonadota bacterium]